MTPEPQTTFTECAEPTCEEKLADHAWGRIKADDWFQQKDGTIWCPEHHPEWVAAWREKQAREEAYAQDYQSQKLHEQEMRAMEDGEV